MSARSVFRTLEHCRQCVCEAEWSQSIDLFNKIKQKARGHPLKAARSFTGLAAICLHLITEERYFDTFQKPSGFTKSDFVAYLNEIKTYCPELFHQTNRLKGKESAKSGALSTPDKAEASSPSKATRSRYDQLTKNQLDSLPANSRVITRSTRSSNTSSPTHIPNISQNSPGKYLAQLQFKSDNGGEGIISSSPSGSILRNKEHKRQSLSPAKRVSFNDRLIHTPIKNISTKRAFEPELQQDIDAVASIRKKRRTDMTSVWEIQNVFDDDPVDQDDELRWMRWDDWQFCRSQISKSANLLDHHKRKILSTRL